jgi:hypothetical protein
VTFSIGPTFGPGPGGSQDADPGPFAGLGFGGSPASTDGSSLLFDSDGYPVSIGPEDWGVVSALGLDNYSRLGRTLGANGALGSGDTGSWTFGAAAPSVGPPLPTNVAPETQPVDAVSPTDLASLAPIFAAQLPAQGGADHQSGAAAPNVAAPPPALTATGANAAPAAVADTSALADASSLAVEPATWSSSGIIRGGGGHLARNAQTAADRPSGFDPFAKAPPGPPPFRPPPSSLSPLISLGLGAAQDASAWAPRIGPPPPPLPYWTAALRDGDRGYQEAKARYNEITYPSTIQQAIQSGLDPFGLNHSLAGLALATESGGHFVGGLFRPLIPDDPAHPGRRALRDFIGDSIVNLPLLALGGGEAEGANLQEGVYEFPDLWANDGSKYVGQTASKDARLDYWESVGRLKRGTETF